MTPYLSSSALDNIHLLAAVYDLPDRGRVLCSPHFKFRYGSMFKNPRNPEEVGHFHPGLERIDSFESDEIAYGRCRCGTWSYLPAHVPKWLEPWTDEARKLRQRYGMPEAGANDLVKVQHESGQVSNVGRRRAESAGMKIVGTVDRKRTKRPYMLANWTGMADAGDESGAP